ncbi:hypothetical protein GETHPA_19020 [Geothrix rubra]|uniref:Coiled coil domain-containing protein n=1 Tax=Geothrix rubra TaxID=2927977 RepID=A0ABQ5Q788_9BACT|nr:hypothetical protein [Geothrix rubra]GLH70369.1 hypothetical protein GETHPA_19020 [Geothrix rubra]
MPDSRKAFEDKLEAELARRTAELDALRANIKSGQVAAGAGADLAVEALQRKRDEAQNHLLSLKVASDDTWESLKAGIEQSWLEIEGMFHGSSGKP